MVNSSVLHDNTTHTMSISIIFQLIHWTIVPSIIIGFILFLCFITLVFNIFLKTPTLRENARYVLFVFLLFNDTLYLFLAFYLMLASVYLLHIPVPLCYILYTFSAGSFKVTPCNLAAMAQEQYIAICHPLRHAELCSPQRAIAAFIMICSLVIIPYVAEFCVMVFSMTNIFNLCVICRIENLVVNKIQNIIQSISLILCFITIGIVIIFTYVKVMQVANRVCPQSSSASKAGRTVIIHAFQILLCTSPLLTTLTQPYTSKWPEFFPTIHFFVFTCLPRFLNPLIYGIRDELLRQYIKKFLSRYFC
ncbi:odorant receptor 131-2-like [Dendrobates tinctorius]|uniref:odorant receptor 131-2-like n=1 Tax=Dendrobates tinctorius TaxID=92724 RepID=UPI003CC9F95E